MGELKARPSCARLGPTISIGLAELTIGEIAQHDGVSGALELLLYFGGSQRCVLAQGLAEFLTHFRIAGDDLHVEPEEVAHLVEGGFEDLNRFHLRWIGESFHELGVGGGLHGGAVEFALDHAQVVGNAQNAETNLFHAFPVLAIHGVPFRPEHACLSKCLSIKIASWSGGGKIPRVHELR